MGSNSSFFGLLRRALRAFFQDDVVLRREAGRVQVALAERRPPERERAPTRAEKQSRKEQAELALAREALAALLDEDATLRSSMRHLAFVEHALEKKGWRGLYKVPLEMLQRALEQLESLVTNWSSEGLACLRSKMAVAVLDREHQDADAEAEHYKTAAVLDSPPQVAAQAIEQARASSAADESAALMATYAALGLAPPGDATVELQGEIGSPSNKALVREQSRQQREQVAAPTP